MKQRHLLMLTGLAAAAGLVFFGDNTPADGLAEPLARSKPADVTAITPAMPATRAVASTKSTSQTMILPLLRRPSLAEGAGAGDFAAPADMFRSQSWTPPPVAAKAAAPVAPPLPFVYIGKADDHGTLTVFLARADQTLVVRANMRIDEQYRVGAIAPPLLTLTYLPLNQVQQINIGVLD